MLQRCGAGLTWHGRATSMSQGECSSYKPLFLSSRAEKEIRDDESCGSVTVSFKRRSLFCTLNKTISYQHFFMIRDQLQNLMETIETFRLTR